MKHMNATLKTFLITAGTVLVALVVYDKWIKGKVATV
jgi:hypothetical protein